MTYLDLDGEITRAQYEAALNSLLRSFEDWRIDRGWCTDLYLYVAQLSRTFRWDRSVRDYYPDGWNGQMTLDIPENRTPAEMAQDLREIRGRILGFTLDSAGREVAFRLPLANQFLTHAGLAPYQPEGPTTFRYRVDIARFTMTSGKTAEEIRKQITAYLTKTLKAANVDVYVDGIADPQASTVPESATVALLPRLR